MSKKFIIYILFISIFFNFKLVRSEIFIKAKVNNQIITNIDIRNEKNYLLALNPNLRNLTDKNIDRYAIDSAINEKLKKIEIEKRYEIIVNNNIIDKIVSDLYTEIGISDIEEFKTYINKYNINLDTVKKKIAIEVAWNDYIVQKFNNAVLVDETKIRSEIKELGKKNFEESLLLSEIIFTVSENEKFDDKLKKIRVSINNIGFEETAKIYSISESKQTGGKIGWVFKSQLSNEIANQITKIGVGEYTDPITLPGGFILVKLNEKKNDLLEIDEEEQFKKAINFEKNRQLKMYSTLHYKRIFNQAVINEF